MQVSACEARLLAEAAATAVSAVDDDWAVTGTSGSWHCIVELSATHNVTCKPS
jgi:hypothetical protein